MRVCDAAARVAIDGYHLSDGQGNDLMRLRWRARGQRDELWDRVDLAVV
jgi:hypothetical protein